MTISAVLDSAGSGAAAKIQRDLSSGVPARLRASGLYAGA